MKKELQNLKPGSRLYFMGIGGTGMASVAGLMQEAGYSVTGSDAGVYPPMSTMLSELGIPVASPYSAQNLSGAKPDLVVVANVLSRGNVELEQALASNIPYASFPELLGDLILSKQKSCVVAGTHGKTTTTSLLAHVLEQLGVNPGFMIGGAPMNFPRSFRRGKGAYFAIEGDEYDTAFYDKGPKFLHYRPHHLIANNLEFDHADIYENVEAIEAQFAKLFALVANKKNICANVDDEGIIRVLKATKLEHSVTRVATLGENTDADVSVIRSSANSSSGMWQGEIKTRHFGTLVVETKLSGRHNMANVAQVLACVEGIFAEGGLNKNIRAQDIANAISSFDGVKRRLELLAKWNNIEVYEDFAHHPTAVKLVIEGFRAVHPDRRIIVAFEPRSATQKRNVFQSAYAETLALADRVLIGECPVDNRIPADKRMNIQALQSAIGAKAKAFPNNQDLLANLRSELKPGDAVIFMSSGSFSGTQHELAKELRSRTL